MPASAGRPEVAGPDHPMRVVTREIAAGDGWDRERAARVAAHFDTVVCVELSRAMLDLASPVVGARVHGDAAQLPARTGSVQAVVLVNAFLFPSEVDRVLGPEGVVVWVSALGDRTPIYLPPTEVLAALPDSWSGVAAEAGWGEWLVARRE